MLDGLSAVIVTLESGVVGITAGTVAVIVFIRS
jgi:hypothetical protein